MATADHRTQVAKMTGNAAPDFASQLDLSGLDPSIVADILRVLVEEGGLTWNALTKIIALLWARPFNGPYGATYAGCLSVNVGNPGSGYSTPPEATIFGGGGVGATAVVTLSGTSVGSVAITNQGSGYTSPPSISFSGGGGANATATVNCDYRSGVSYPTPEFDSAGNRLTPEFDAAGNRVYGPEFDSAGNRLYGPEFDSAGNPIPDSRTDEQVAFDASHNPVGLPPQPDPRPVRRRR